MRIATFFATMCRDYGWGWLKGASGHHVRIPLKYENHQGHAATQPPAGETAGEGGNFGSKGATGNEHERKIRLRCQGVQEFRGASLHRAPIRAARQRGLLDLLPPVLDPFLIDLAIGNSQTLRQACVRIGRVALTDKTRGDISVRPKHHADIAGLHPKLVGDVFREQVSYVVIAP